MARHKRVVQVQTFFYQYCIIICVRQIYAKVILRNVNGVSLIFIKTKYSPLFSVADPGFAEGVFLAYQPRFCNFCQKDY